MTTDTAISTVWEYHQLRHDLKPADIIWALGSHDLRVADRVAELWHRGLAPRIVMSGGLGNFTEGVFQKPEAVMFAERAVELGVPEDIILIEDRSSNTGENVTFSRELLAKQRLSIRSAIAVQKPYMERRSFATIRKQWPELEVQVTSPCLDFQSYCSDSISEQDVVNIMVGDLQRIMRYPELGFMIPQEIPEDVMRAWQCLVEAGYDQHLIKAR